MNVYNDIFNNKMRQNNFDYDLRGRYLKCGDKS